MSHPTLSPIERALRNRRILAWLHEWSGRPLLDAISVAYAAHLSCPVCEVDPLWGDPDYLDWIAGRYGNAIAAWQG